MNRFDGTIVGYSLLLLIGGLIGYFMAGSSASLLMSSIFAALLIGSLFLIRVFPAAGYRTVSTLLVILTLFFAYRWYTIKFMPSGLLTILSLIILCVTFFMKRSKQT